ncbi:hypothetical protein HN51_031205, partial [Arachis hypogaea]
TAAGRIVRNNTHTTTPTDKGDDVRQDGEGRTTRGRRAHSRDKARKATRKSIVSRERNIRIDFETLPGL